MVDILGWAFTQALNAAAQALSQSPLKLSAGGESTAEQCEDHAGGEAHLRAMASK